MCDPAAATLQEALQALAWEGFQSAAVLKLVRSATSGGVDSSGALPGAVSTCPAPQLVYDSVRR
jgi:hypothetical protein